MSFQPISDYLKDPSQGVSLDLVISVILLILLVILIYYVLKKIFWSTPPKDSYFSVYKE